jgi:hypothetical protein
MFAKIYDQGMLKQDNNGAWSIVNEKAEQEQLVS